MSKQITKFKETEIGPIPEEWEVLTIGDLGKVITGKTPPTADVENYGGDVPFICIPDLGKGVYVKKTAKTISTKGVETVRNCVLPKDSVVVSCIATIGLVGITEKSSVTNQQINSIICYESVLPKFLYYRLQQFQHLLGDYGGGGSVFNIVSKSKFEKIPLAIPPLDEQKRIADVLSSLDEKIELNRKMNKTLEEIAQALFKQWFVDFEFPADSASRNQAGEPIEPGKPYKSSGGKMIDSDLGPIPEGWRAELMTDFVEIGKGLSYKGTDLDDAGSNVLVGLKCFERGGGFRIDGVKRFKGDFKEQHLLSPGDLIVAMTDPTQGAEVLGKPALVPTIENAEQIIASLDLAILKPKSGLITKTYLYLLFIRQETQDFLFGYSNGSTVLHLSIKGLQALKIVVPSTEILNTFNAVADPLFEKIQSLNDEILMTSSLRDSLLPRLMSGKIRV